MFGYLEIEKYSRNNVFRPVGSGNIAKVFMKLGSAINPKTVDFTAGSKCAVIISRLDNDPANGCRIDAINFCCIAAFFASAFVVEFLLPGGRPRLPVGTDTTVGAVVAIVVVDIIVVDAGIETVVMLIAVVVGVIPNEIAFGTAGILAPVGVRLPVLTIIFELIDVFISTETLVGVV